MNKLLMFLIYRINLVLNAGVVEDQDPFVDDSPEESEEPANEEMSDSAEESEDSEEDEEPEPKISRRQAEVIKLRQERQESDRRYEELKRELETIKTQSTKPQQYVESEEESLRKQEDAILSNPNSEDWQKYAVRSARDAREAKRAGHVALQEALDISDRAEFIAKYSVEQPKAFAAYKDRVEEKMKEFKSQGRTAKRHEVYAYLLGKDMAEGKLKASMVKSDSKTAGGKRGSTPNVRSDVSAKSSGRMTEAEKRAKRLENVRI